MAAYELKVLSSNKISENNNEEEFSIPICMGDIITICREYTKLNWQVQGQIEDILEIGVENAIEKGSIQKSSLDDIKNFLYKISDNVYFGDAISQANDCINLIRQYEDDHNINVISRYN